MSRRGHHLFTQTPCAYAVNSESLAHSLAITRHHTAAEPLEPVDFSAAWECLCCCRLKRPVCYWTGESVDCVTCDHSYRRRQKTSGGRTSRCWTTAITSR